MIMNVQQNAGAPAYAPPPPPQAAPAPVIIQQQKSNTTCIVCTLVCVCCVVPIGIFIIMFVMAAAAVTNIASDIDFNTPPPTTDGPVIFTDGGTLNHYADICAADFEYTAGSGALESPNYPSNYPGNTDCTNRIGTASDGVTFEIDAFDTETNYDEVTFVNANNELYTFTGYSYAGGPQVGDRFSFSTSYVDVRFESDFMGEESGFSIRVIDGYEPANDITNLGYASRVINKEDLPEKEAKKNE
ncbi:unnamed protein product [Oikopleura dioica]|nr:unnamed protein product [Oikopleura dioica]